MTWRHTHQIWDVRLTAKACELELRCHCGESVYMAEWHLRMPRGWSQRQWKRARLALFAATNALRGVTQ